MESEHLIKVTILVLKCPVGFRLQNCNVIKLMGQEAGPESLPKNLH